MTGRPRRPWRAPLVALAFGAACVAGPARGPSREAGPEIPIRDRYAGARLELLAAINADRRAAAAAPVALDSAATVVAQRHAAAMVAGGFFSHYGALGEAPYERAARAGLAGHVQENVYRWQVRHLSAVGTVDPWPAFDVVDAHASLMRSPGHRETILDPRRTHVGLGIAADSAAGAVVVVEDFLGLHAAIDPPRLTWPGSSTRLAGRILDPGLRPLLVLLHREPDDGPGTSGSPPPGPYRDGRGEARIVPPWVIEWRAGPLIFEADLGPYLRESGRWYGVVYVAPRRIVESAVSAGAVRTEQGWPGAAFLVDVF